MAWPEQVNVPSAAEDAAETPPGGPSLEATAIEATLRQQSRVWLAVFFGGLAILSLGLVPNYVFLEHCNELMSVDEIAHRQLTSGGRFQSGMREDQVFHKLALYREVKPDVTVLGSSRVMEFRDDTFTKPMVNLAGCAQSFRELEALLDAALAIHTPKLVILGLDFWWFNPERDDPPMRYPVTKPASRFTPAALLLPFEWLSKHKITREQYVDILLHPQNDFGIQAIARHTGYEADGRYQYTSWVDGSEPTWDRDGFAATRKWVARGAARDALADTRFAWADHVDERRVETLARLVSKLKSRQIPFVMLTAPVPDRVRAAMDATGKYGYLAGIHDAVAALGGPFFDFQDKRRWPVDDCEYLDGFHPGEVATLRMLDVMADDPTVGPYVDRPKVRAWVTRYDGFASIPTKADLPSYREVDFNGLGCPKTERPAAP